MKTPVFRSTNRPHWGVLFAALLLAGYAFGLPLDAAALTLTRGPYLQLETQSSVVVRWRTDTATNSRVRYGTNPSKLSSVVDDASSTTEHVVKLTGLKPSTKYYYSVGRRTATLAGDASHFFVTAPTLGTEQPIHIWVVGNSGTANAKARAVRDAYLKYKDSQYTHLWLMLGDNAYPDGTDSDYQSAVFSTYPTLLRQTVLWPTLGRRDGITADSPSQSGAYYDIFSLPKRGEAGGLASGTEAHYSFDYGNIHFVVLDSVETSKAPAGAMLTWLKNDLAATTQRWIIASWHHPPYSKGSHDSNTETALREMRKNALPILEDAGVDLVLNGHSGSYERSFLIDGHYGSSGTFEAKTMLVDGGDGRIDGNGEYQKSVNDKPVRGAVYTVVGSSGETQGGSLDHPVMHVSLNTLGSMVLDVNGPALDAAFLDDTGQIRDRFRMVKTTDTAKVSTSTSDVPTTRVSPKSQTAPVDPASGGTVSDAAGNTSLRSSDTSATTQSLSSTSNLVAHWTFDIKNIDVSKSSAEVRDVSGYNNHADLKNHSGTTVPGKLGQALSVDGVDDHAEKISFSGLPRSAITVSAWIKLDANKNWNRVLNHEWVNNGWLLFTDASGTAIFGVGQSGAQYNATKAGLTVGSWYHLVGVYDGSNVRVYVNGKEGTPMAKSGLILDNAGNVDIGGAERDRFKGAIDDVRIYNKALTGSDVRALYGGTTDTSPPTPPSNLTANAVSASQINLWWNASTDNVGVMGYKVYRGGAQIATTSGISYANTGLASSTTYTYTVAAYDAAGNTSAQASSAAATTQGALPTSSLSITSYGATGNDTTDDTTAINNTINAAKSQGKSVFVPAGTFYHKEFTLDGVSMTGAGNTTSILYAPDARNNTVNVRGNGVTVSNLQLKSVATVRTPEDVHLYIIGATNFTIDNIIVDGSNSSLIHNQGGAFGKIINNTVRNSLADSIHNTGGAHDIIIANNTVRNGTDDLIAMVSYGQPAVRNFLVQDNDISGNSGGRGISSVSSSDITIQGNKISNTACCAGILVATEQAFSSETTPLSNVLIRNNQLSNNGGSTGHSAFLISGLRGNINKIRFEGNTITNPVDEGIKLEGDNTNVALINNTISDPEGRGFWIVSGFNVYCSGDTLNGSATSPSNCTGANNFAVTGSSLTY
ncbi:MAG: LamG-like jellyroll fold domain-containing protein [Gammaproteobacteria bacterium]